MRASVVKSLVRPPSGKAARRDLGGRARDRGRHGRDPARGRGRRGRSGRARQGGVPRLARGRAGPALGAPARPGRRASRHAQEDLAVLEARNAGKPIGDARGEMGMVVETFRYYAGAPERLLGDTIPVSGGIDMTFREPLGVVGLIVPWNFPLVIAAWKLGAGAGGRQHRGAQARRADPADRGRAGEDRRGGAARGRAQRGRGPGQRVRPATGRAPRRGQGRLHRVHRGRPRRSPARPPTPSSASRWSWAASRPTSCSPTPTWRRPRPPRRCRCSATRARTAARARASWSSATPWTVSPSCWTPL